MFNICMWIYCLGFLIIIRIPKHIELLSCLKFGLQIKICLHKKQRKLLKNVQMLHKKH